MSKQFVWFFMLLLTVVFLLLSAGCGTQPEPTPEPTPAEPAEPVIDYNEMVFVPAGKCIIGGPFEDAVTKASSPPHEVNLKAFWLDKYEVTYEQFLQFVAESGYATKGNWRVCDPNKPLHPIYNVIYSDAEAYAKWAKKRLPSQEEWEKAALWDEKTQKPRKFPWGDEWVDSAANSGSRVLMNIGESKGDVSFYGAHDMLGNIFEWTSSYYDPYPGTKAKDRNYGIKLMVVKGASLYIDGTKYPLAARAAFPNNYQLGVGFRCAKDATPEAEAKYKDLYK